MKSKLVLMSLLLSSSVVLSLNAREWTDSTGVFTVEADLVEVAGGTVRLKKTDGTIIAVPLERLSDADQQYLKSPDKKPAGEKKSTPGGAEAAIETALMQPNRMEFIETPLIDIVEFLKDMHGIPIGLDRRALDDVGIGSDVPITARRGQGDLAANLDAILDPLDLTWIVRHEVLLITTKATAEANCPARVYKLLRQVPFDDLLRDITGNINPQSWDTVGGPGSLCPMPPGVLVVTQTQATHRQIEKHYKGVLKRVRMPFPATVPGLVGPAVAKILLEPTRIEFIETPLKDIVEFLKGVHDVEITLDARALEDVGIGTDTPITMNVKGVKLSSGLSLMLKDSELVWTADKTGIGITTPEAAANVELVAYSVNGLVQAGQADHLIEAVTSCVAPQSWHQVGGPGSIRMGIRGTLDVRQCFGVHQQVAHCWLICKKHASPSALLQLSVWRSGTRQEFRPASQTAESLGDFRYCLSPES